MKTAETPQFGMSRTQAAQHVGLSEEQLVKAVNQGFMARPRDALGTVIWIRPDLDAYLNNIAASLVPAAKSGVYFVQAGEFVKIGWSRNIPFRIAELQSANPLTLQLLAVAEVDPFAERALHVKFAAQRFRGEWFRLEGELRAFLFGEEDCDG